MISRHVEFVYMYLAFSVSFVRLEEGDAGHVGH